MWEEVAVAEFKVAYFPIFARRDWRKPRQILFKVAHVHAKIWTLASQVNTSVITTLLLRSLSVLKQGAAAPTVADRVFLFKKMDVFT